MACKVDHVTDGKFIELLLVHLARQNRQQLRRIEIWALGGPYIDKQTERIFKLLAISYSSEIRIVGAIVNTAICLLF